MNEKFMREAIRLAKAAAQHADVPVGAVIVKNETIVARGENRKQQDENPLLHAEIDAIAKAAQALPGKVLDGCTLYVTLEPCAMCAGAIINARIENVVFGAYDERFGACGSVCNLFEMPFNHRPNVKGGVLAEECGEILKEFFKNKRLS